MKLQEKRKSAGLSQSQLAEKSGISVRVLQNYEQGSRDINKASGETLKKLADALGCQIENIMEEK